MLLWRVWKAVIFWRVYPHIERWIPPCKIHVSHSLSHRFFHLGALTTATCTNEWKGCYKYPLAFCPALGAEKFPPLRTKRRGPKKFARKEHTGAWIYRELGSRLDVDVLRACLRTSHSLGTQEIAHMRLDRRCSSIHQFFSSASQHVVKSEI